MIIAHRISRQKTGVTQRREFFLSVARLDNMSTHEIPMVQSISNGIFIVTQDLLCFRLSARHGNRIKQRVNKKIQ